MSENADRLLELTAIYGGPALAQFKTDLHLSDFHSRAYCASIGARRYWHD